MSYAIVWRESEGAEYSGRLELQADRIVLSGSKAGSRTTREVPYDDLAAAALERRSSGRATTRPTLILSTSDESRLEIASLDGLGALHELAERIEGARGKAAA